MFRGMQAVLRLLFVDMKLATSIVKQAKSLYFLIIAIWIANLVLISKIGTAELTVNDLVIKTAKYFGLTILILLTYEVWKYFRASKSSKELIQFWIFYRSLAWLSWLIDLLIILMIIKYGFWIEMAILQPVYILICIWILIIYDRLLANGQDLLLIDDLQDLPNGKSDIETAPEGNFYKKITFYVKIALKKFSIWILCSRTRIFILGSLWFEPDIATLLLRKEKRTTIRRIATTTLPMAIICNTFWSAVFYLGIIGYDYFRWFIE